MTRLEHDGRKEELQSVHMHSSLLQLRDLITKLFTSAETDIQVNEA